MNLPGQQTSPRRLNHSRRITHLADDPGESTAIKTLSLFALIACSTDSSITKFKGRALMGGELAGPEVALVSQGVSGERM